MYPLAIGLVIQNSSLWADVNATLRELPFRVVADFHAVPNPDAAILQLADRRPDIVFVEVRDASANRIIAKLKELNACPTIVALHRSPTVEIVVDALRSGANEFLQAPTPEMLQELLKRAQERMNPRRQGAVVAILSVKGGCGATTIACHSAVAIGSRYSEREKRALLMDLDLSTGLARFIMKAQTNYSVLDAVRNLQKLDLNFWNALVCPTHPGLDVLCAPEDLSPAQQLDRDQVQNMLGFARGQYDRIILDLGRGLGQLASAILPEVSDIYLVATPEISPLHMTRNILRSLEAKGYPADRVHLVVNRASHTGAAMSKQIEKVLGVPVFLSLPNDYETLSDCYSSGRLLPQRNKLAAGIHALAAAMMGERPEVKKNLAARLFQTAEPRIAPAGHAVLQ